MQKKLIPTGLPNPTLARAAHSGLPTEDEQLFIRQELKAPPNFDFTRTDPWRVMRITGEFVSGFDALAHIGPAISIFGSARIPETDPFYEKARRVAYLLGKQGFSVITGGGPGIMEAANRGAHEAGVQSVGCNIELPYEQAFNSYVTVPINFRYFFVRKTMFMKYSEGFIIFPGGFGTLDELFEALALIQNGKVRDFLVILVGTTYWEGLLSWMRRSLLEEGKISDVDLDHLVVTDSANEVVRLIVDSMRRHSWEQNPHVGNSHLHVEELSDDPALLPMQNESKLRHSSKKRSKK